MSNVRIRYGKTDDGKLRSRRVFKTADGQDVVAELDLTNKKFSVINAATGEVVLTAGQTRNTAVLKIQCKQALTNLGVEFGAEARERDGRNVGA